MHVLTHLVQTKTRKSKQIPFENVSISREFERAMYMVNLHVTASINIEGIENKWGTPSKHNNVKKKKEEDQQIFLHKVLIQQ